MTAIREIEVVLGERSSHDFHFRFGLYIIGDLRAYGEAKVTDVRHLKAAAALYDVAAPMWVRTDGNEHRWVVNGAEVGTPVLDGYLFLEYPELRPFAENGR